MAVLVHSKQAGYLQQLWASFVAASLRSLNALLSAKACLMKVVKVTDLTTNRHFNKENKIGELSLL